MRAVAEGDVVAGAALDVELVGVGEGAAVPVGGHGRGDDALARLDGDAADLDVLGGDPGDGVGDGEVAQHLLDGHRDLGRVGDDRGQLLRVLQETDGAQRDHVGRGLVPRDEQQERHADQFWPVDRAGFLLLGDQPADHVVVGVRGLGVDEFAEVVAQFVDERLAVGDVDVAVEQGAAALLEEVVVGVGNAEQFADDQGRDRQRQRLDQVDRAVVAGEHRVDALVDDLLDAWAQAGEPFDGELADGRAAGARVVGRRPCRS